MLLLLPLSFPTPLLIINLPLSSFFPQPSLSLSLYIISQKSIVFVTSRNSSEKLTNNGTRGRGVSTRSVSVRLQGLLLLLTQLRFSSGGRRESPPRNHQHQHRRQAIHKLGFFFYLRLAKCQGTMGFSLLPWSLHQWWIHDSTSFFLGGSHLHNHESAETASHEEREEQRGNRKPEDDPHCSWTEPQKADERVLSRTPILDALFLRSEGKLSCDNDK